jgi:hypothetical protein
MKHSAEAIFLTFGGAAFAIMWVLSYALDHISLLDLFLFSGLGLAIMTCGIVMGQRVMERKRR